MTEKEKSWLDIGICFLTVIAIVFLDRMTKVFFSNLLELGESLPVVYKVFHFSLVHNTGIAFGLFKDNSFVYLVIPMIAVVLLVYNIYYYRKFEELSRLYIIGFSLILGGALGNLWDRLVFGYVIDFFDFRIWPVFNIADSAITIGAMIILFKCFPAKKKKE